MSEPIDFEKISALGATAQAAMDQVAASMRPCMTSLASFEQACREAGMSEPAAAAFTIDLARSLGWPPIGNPA